MSDDARFRGFMEATTRIPEDKGLSELCDRLLVDGDQLAGVARYWLTHHNQKLRQQAVFGMCGLLAEIGMDPRSAQAYRRGYTAGLQVASDLFRGQLHS